MLSGQALWMFFHQVFLSEDHMATKSLLPETDEAQRRAMDRYLANIESGRYVDIGPTDAHEFSRYLFPVVNRLCEHLRAVRSNKNEKLELACTQALVDLMYCGEKRKKLLCLKVRYRILGCLTTSLDYNDPWSVQSGEWLRSAFAELAKKQPRWAARLGRTLVKFVQSGYACDSRSCRTAYHQATLAACLGAPGIEAVKQFIRSYPTAYADLAKLTLLLEAQLSGNKLLPQITALRRGYQNLQVALEGLAQ